MKKKIPIRRFPISGDIGEIVTDSGGQASLSPGAEQ